MEYLKELDQSTELLHFIRNKCKSLQEPPSALDTEAKSILKLVQIKVISVMSEIMLIYIGWVSDMWSPQDKEH